MNDSNYHHKKVLKEGKLVSEEYIKDKYKIKNPEFKFIFTIDLDGKIDIYNEVKKGKISEESKFGIYRAISNTPIQREEYSEIKEDFFLEYPINCDGRPGCPGCGKNDDPRFIGYKLSSKDIRHHMPNVFINKAVVASWIYNLEFLKRPQWGTTYEKKDGPPGKDLENQWKDKIKPNIGRYYKSRKKDGVDQYRFKAFSGDKEDITNRIADVRCIKNIDIKLFSTGTLSIVIDINLHDDDSPISLDVYTLTSLIRHPHLAAENFENIDDDDKKKDRNSSGYLNVVAYEVASAVSNDLFRCLHASKDDLPSPKALKVMRIVEKRDETRYLITNRHMRGLYTKKTAFCTLTQKPKISKLSDRIVVRISKDRRKYEDGVEIVSPGKYKFIYKGDVIARDADILLKQYKNNKSDLKLLLSLFKKLMNVSEYDSLLNRNYDTTLSNEYGKIPYEGRYLYNAPLHVNPYICVKFDEVPDAYLDKNKLNCLLTSIATHNPDYMDGIRLDDDFIKKSISYGAREAILIERRGMVAAGSRLGVHEDAKKDVAYETILFCLESTFATTKSISSFNKELEEYVSRQITDMLDRENRNLYKKLPLYNLGIALLRPIKFRNSKTLDHIEVRTKWRLKYSLFRNNPNNIVYDPIVKHFVSGDLLMIFILMFSFGLILFELLHLSFFLIAFGSFFYISNVYYQYTQIRLLRELVDKARTLSPCEDFSANITPFIRSAIAVRAAKRAQDFGFTSLWEVVHARLENYGHFLKTSQEATTLKIGGVISVLAVYFTYVTIFTGNNGGGKNTIISQLDGEVISFGRTINNAIACATSILNTVWINFVNYWY